MDIVSPVPKASTGGRNTSDDPIRVLYISGTGRIGSTILCRALGEQPHFHPLGEAIDLWKFGVLENCRCSCGSLFHDCQFWQDVADSAPGLFDRTAASRFAALADTLFRTRELPRLWTPWTRSRIADDLLPEYLLAISRLYEAIRTVSGARVIIDGSKSPMYGYLLSLVGNLDVTTVQMVRDPRAVAFSLQRKVRDPGHAESPYLPRYRPLVVAAVWMMSYLSQEIVNRLNSSREHLLRYEDFVSDPTATTRWLVELAGEAYLGSGPGAERQADLSPVHMVNGNPNRFVSGTVPITLDDEWKKALPTAQRRVVTTMTFPFLTRYGYLDRSARRCLT
jgi:hypothetical protein